VTDGGGAAFRHYGYNVGESAASMKKSEIVSEMPSCASAWKIRYHRWDSGGAAGANMAAQAKSLPTLRARPRGPWWDYALLTLACAAPVFTAIGDFPVALTIGLIVPALVTLQWLVQRRGGWRLIGPHGYYDLVRLSRKPRVIVLRVLFLLALFGCIWYTYRQSGLQSELDVLSTAQLRTHLARLNTQCVYTWLLLQNITILILTPAYVGGAIAEERERGTFDLLLTTELNHREILLGKLLARVTHLGAFLVAGLPVYSMMLVWGGIDFRLLLAGWINSVLLLLAVGSACLMFSTMPVRTSTAVIVSYTVVLPTGIGWLACTYRAIQEFALSAGPGPDQGGFVVVLFAYASAIGFCLFIATIAMLPADQPPDEVAYLARSRRERTAPAAQQSAEEPIPVPAASLEARGLTTNEPRRPPLRPVGDNALLWKECHTGDRCVLLIPEVLVMAVMPLIMITPLLCVVVSEIINQSDGTLTGIRYGIANQLGGFLHAGYVVCLLSYIIGVAFRSAVCVVRERQMHTLDMLLQLPIERGEILRAKWSGALLKGWPWLIALIAALALGLVIGVYDPSTFLLMLFAPLPVIVVLSTAGLLISTIVRTTTQANLSMACTLLVFVLVGYRWPERLFGYLPGSRGGWPHPLFQPDDLAALVVSAVTLLLVAAAMRVFAGWAFARR
jgi:ABC-type transport system involved in multi-copper enzyme maturation permease subunit